MAAFLYWSKCNFSLSGKNSLNCCVGSYVHLLMLFSNWGVVMSHPEGPDRVWGKGSNVFPWIISLYRGAGACWYIPEAAVCSQGCKEPWYSLLRVPQHAEILKITMATHFQFAVAVITILSVSLCWGTLQCLVQNSQHHWDVYQLLYTASGIYKQAPAAYQRSVIQGLMWLTAFSPHPQVVLFENYCSNVVQWIKSIPRHRWVLSFSVFE